MPLTEKEQKIKRSMYKTYGSKEGESVFYASVNKGKFGQASKKRHRGRPASKRNR